MHNTIDNGEILLIRGHSVRVEITPDYDQELPWENCDGMGIVREVRNQKDDKRAGERPFGERFQFDFQATIKEATRDAWGLDKAGLEALAAQLGRPPTKKQIVAQSVENAFEYLQSWANEEWQYHGYTVTLMNSDDDGEVSESDNSDSCWGFEFWFYDDSKNSYFFDQIRAAAASLVLQAETETSEVKYWESRGIETVAARH